MTTVSFAVRVLNSNSRSLQILLIGLFVCATAYPAHGTHVSDLLLVKIYILIYRVRTI